MTRMNQVVSDTIATHSGVRPVEQGEGDSFVAAFARASDAVACALELQRAPLAPIRLRIGIHTGEIQLRDEGTYAGPTINRTARLRYWVTAAKPCCPVPPKRSCWTGFPTTCGCPIWAPTRCVSPRPERVMSSAIQIWSTNSLPCECRKWLYRSIFRCS